MKIRVLTLLTVVCGLLLHAPMAAASFRIESLDNNFPEEIQDAAADGKSLVVFFHQAGCPYCDKMRARVFPAKKIVDYFSPNFVMIDSNIRGNLDVVMYDGTRGTEHDLAKKLRVRATPVIVFFDKQGKVALRTTGFLDVDMFYLAGRYVTEGVFKTKKSFFRFVQEQKQQ